MCRSMKMVYISNFRNPILYKNLYMADIEKYTRKGCDFMKCRYCNSEIPNHSRYCPECGKDLTQNNFGVSPQNENIYSGQQYTSTNGKREEIINATPYIIGSIITMLCCCQILGIPALIFSVKINDAITYEEAEKNAKIAKYCIIAAIVFGALLIAISIPVNILGLMNESMANQSYV